MDSTLCGLNRPCIAASFSASGRLYKGLAPSDYEIDEALGLPPG